MAKIFFHGVCKDGFQLTTEGSGETLGAAEIDGDNKIATVCASHGGKKRIDRGKSVRSSSRKRDRN